MHGLKLIPAQRQAYAGAINRLPSGHAGAACGARELRNSLHDQGRRDRHLRQQLKSQGLKRIASQHGAGLIKLHVHGRTTTPQLVVIHARQVVMNQRVGMDQFDCGRSQLQRFLLRRRHGLALQGRFASGIDQGSAHALAAAQNSVTHRLVQAARLYRG